MKNIFRFLMAVAVLFTASCAKEDISSSIGGGEEVEMTFTVDLPELGTRANTYGNGANATLLRYYVFDAANGAELEALRGTATRTSGNFTFTLPLLKGMKYHIALWADKNVGTAEVPKGFYAFDGKVVTVNYVNANDNDRDAFYHYEPNFDPTDPRTTTFTLYRPFAQLNAAVVNSDIEAVAKNGVALETSTVEVTTYTQFNLATGDVVESSKTVVNTFAATDMPYEAGETLKSGYTYLSMNYILAPKAGSVSDVTFTFNNNKGINFGATYTNVPLKQNFRTNILGALLTAPTNFTVEIEAEFNKPDQIVATDAAAAQEALDNAVPGTVIKLKSSVNYGTLYLRPVAGGAQTKVVDWQGNNYHWETYSCFENITIIGAEGATVDAIKIEGGTYYNTEHSQAATYPVMLSLVELKNVVLDGVTFTGKGGYDPQGYGNAINVSGSNIKVDGLTLKNCVLNNSENNARLLYKTESTTHVHTYTYDGNTFTFTPSLKDITVTDCTLNGGYMGLELRETENITITNNEFNVANRNILLPVNSGCTYTGNVTITGNISNNAKERFVRMAGASDAVVVIKDNIINNYLGTDADYIKVTDGTNVTIENNTLTTPIDTVDKLRDALANAVDNTVIVLAGVDFGGVDLYNSTNNGHRYNYANYDAKNVKIIGVAGTSFSGLRLGENDYEPVMTGWTFENIAFNGNGLIISLDNNGVVVKNCKFINAELQNTGTNTYQAVNFTVEGCTFEGSRATRNTQLALQNSNGVTVSGCTFSNAAYNAMNITKVYGDVTISGNTINQTADRPLRLTIADAAATLDINNNTIISNGDSNGELVKVSADGATVTESNITLTNNTWNGKSDSEVVSGMVDGAYIVKKIFVVTNADELKAAIINGGKIELANDITVDQWIMFSEIFNIGTGQIITVKMDGLTIDGKGHTLTVNDIESAGNGDLLFDEASNLNIKNLTINYAAGVAGGISLKSGVISKVNFVGGVYGIYPGEGEILVEDCTFATNGDALYFEQERDNLTVNHCTFNQPAGKNVILLRGDVKFTNNTVNSGRTVNIVSGSPVVSGNDFNDVRLKVYPAATATVSNNIINNLVFETTTHSSTFTNNTLSAAAQAALDAATN